MMMASRAKSPRPKSMRERLKEHRAQIVRIKELDYCKLGDVKTLATCKTCGKIVRVFVKWAAVVMAPHRCMDSLTSKFIDCRYVLRELPVGPKKHLFKRVWVLL